MTRCPYCHSDVDATAPRSACRACRAVAHAACALELGRCGACGRSDFERWVGADADGWELRDGGGGQVFVRAAPRELLAAETSGSPRLSLDLPRRDACVGGLLAGHVVLAVPQAAVLGPLAVSLRCEQTTRGFLGSPRRRERTLRSFALLGGPGRGLYAPGIHRASFRIPLEGVPVTRDEPGADPHERILLGVRLDRPGRALVASIEVRILAASERIRVEPSVLSA